MKKIKNKNLFGCLSMVVAFLLLDGFFRGRYFSTTPFPLYDQISISFLIGWIALFVSLALVLPKLVRRIYIGFLTVLFSILALVQTAYFNLFNKFFSFTDLSLLSEGTEFMDMSYIYFSKSVLLAVLLFIGFMMVAFFLFEDRPFKDKNVKLTTVALVFVSFLGLWGGKQAVPKPVGDGWNASNDPGYIYRDFKDTSKAMIMTSFYEYTFRDLYLTYNPFEEMERNSIIDQLDNKFSTMDEKLVSNEMSGIYKDKNLVYILLENIDNWMLTEENMPALYYARTNGIDFVNHYSSAFATGRTFNTEFQANLSLIPPMKGQAPSYEYALHTFPYSIANKFKEEGYSVNSYHRSNGSIYNRAMVHENAFGYEKYHSYSEIGMEDPDLDSQMIAGYDVMIKDEKYMDFLITYSGHAPFTYDNTACSLNLDYVRSFTDSDDEKYVCGLAQAHETDVYFQDLFKRMYEEGELEDTVFVFFTDHYAYGALDPEVEFELKGTTDKNLIQNTPFFIWSYGIQPQKVEKVTNTVDILPTVLNLFGIDYNPNYYVGRDAFSDFKGLAMFSDGSWYDGTIYYESKNADQSDYEKEISAYMSERLNTSWDILNSNYFSEE